LGNVILERVFENFISPPVYADRLRPNCALLGDSSGSGGAGGKSRSGRLTVDAHSDLPARDLLDAVSGP
jgi:hypothetical protein